MKPVSIHEEGEGGKQLGWHPALCAITSGWPRGTLEPRLPGEAGPQTLNSATPKVFTVYLLE